MPLQRFQKLDPERKQAILAAAEAEFCARGFAAASYNEIIKAAGLSKGAMYYYFADKADLCQTVIERALDHMGEAVGGLGPFTDAPGFWGEVRAMTARAMVLIMTLPKLGALGRLIYDEGSGVLGELEARCEAWCAQQLELGQAVGAVRVDMPLELLATAVTGLLVHTDRWFARQLDTIETMDLQELERLSMVCLDMVEQVASPPTV